MPKRMYVPYVMLSSMSGVTWPTLDVVSVIGSDSASIWQYVHEVVPVKGSSVRCLFSYARHDF